MKVVKEFLAFPFTMGGTKSLPFQVQFSCGIIAVRSWEKYETSAGGGGQDISPVGSLKFAGCTCTNDGGKERDRERER